MWNSSFRRFNECLVLNSLEAGRRANRHRIGKLHKQTVNVLELKLALIVIDVYQLMAKNKPVIAGTIVGRLYSALRPIRNTNQFAGAAPS